MNYGQLHQTCVNKFKEYDEAMCARALHDCHVTLQLNNHLSTDDAYYIKLWQRSTPSVSANSNSAGCQHDHDV